MQSVVINSSKSIEAVAAVSAKVKESTPVATKPVVKIEERKAHLVSAAKGVVVEHRTSVKTGKDLGDRAHFLVHKKGGKLGQPMSEIKVQLKAAGFGCQEIKNMFSRARKAGGDAAWILYQAQIEVDRKAGLIPSHRDLRQLKSGALRSNVVFTSADPIVEVKAKAVAKPVAQPEVKAETTPVAPSIKGKGSRKTVVKPEAESVAKSVAAALSKMSAADRALVIAQLKK